jgi:hypothetical protein
MISTYRFKKEIEMKLKNMKFALSAFIIAGAVHAQNFEIEGTWKLNSESNENMICPLSYKIEIENQLYQEKEKTVARATITTKYIPYGSRQIKESKEVVHNLGRYLKQFRDSSGGVVYLEKVRSTKIQYGSKTTKLSDIEEYGVIGIIPRLFIPNPMEINLDLEVLRSDSNQLISKIRGSDSSYKCIYEREN